MNYAQMYHRCSSSLQHPHEVRRHLRRKRDRRHRAVGLHCQGNAMPFPGMQNASKK